MVRIRLVLLFPAILLSLTEIRVVAEEAVVPPLVSVAEVRAMSPQEIDREPMVRVRGIVTYFEELSFSSFLQDGDAGIFVYPGNAIKSEQLLLNVGDHVEIQGSVHPGSFAPVINDSRSGRLVTATRLGHPGLPEPVPLPPGRISDPAFHNRFVTFSGVVRTIDRDAGRNRLVAGISTPAGIVEAVIPRFDPEAPLPLSWIDTPVRVDGVISGRGDSDGQKLEATLYIPLLDRVVPQTIEIERIFAEPPRAVSSLGRFDARSSFEKRVHVEGVLTLQLPGAGVFLRVGDAGLWVQSFQQLEAIPGAVLGAAGFPAQTDRQPMLQDAILRPRGQSAPPQPLAISLGQARSGRHHADLVRLEAEILNVVSTGPNRLVLVLEAEGRRFRAEFPSGIKDLKPRAVAPGSWVSIAGICLNEHAQSGSQPSDGVEFSLKSRSPADLVLLREPPWWTPRRVGVLLVSLIAAALGSAVWVGLLRRRVAWQTRLIRQKLEREVVWEERNRIARELHDTLEQQLAGITMQLDAATARLPAAPDLAWASLKQMGAMIRHSREEARRSVWDLRSHTLETAGLAETLREMAASFTVTGKGAIHLHTQGTERRLPREIEFHFMRIAQEAMTNAVKHGDAGRIDVHLHYQENALGLEIRDDGRGFDPGALPDGHRGHFGLLGMRERAAKLNASLRIESTPEDGTFICLEVDLKTPQQKLEAT